MDDICQPVSLKYNIILTKKFERRQTLTYQVTFEIIHMFKLDITIRSSHLKDRTSNIVVEYMAIHDR